MYRSEMSYPETSDAKKWSVGGRVYPKSEQKKIPETSSRLYIYRFREQRAKLVYFS